MTISPPSAPPIKKFSDVADDDIEIVGGKGLSLAQLTRAGFPVPAGFCITTVAFSHSDGGAGLSPATAELVRTHYREMGGGQVAVRSSATLEDGSAASFAGQQETFLEIEGDAAVLDAVERCRLSLYGERARAYRRKQGIADADIRMAVVVQRMVASEVAGVLFTRDPLNTAGSQMVIEAARGLGEAVVSGRVMPDLFRTERNSGELVAEQLHGGDTGPALTAAQLKELTALGLRVESHFAGPRDVEWAWADGRFYLLQARPITTSPAMEREEFRRREIDRLAARAEETGTVWARYNLAEVLTEPLPMTWSVVRRMVAGNGGFGRMYRDFGFDPDPTLNDGGAFDLICGRPYVNLSREPKMYFRDFPYGHEFAKLKADPAAAMYPTPTVVPALATLRTWLRLPLIAWKMMRSPAKLTEGRSRAAERLAREVFPSFRDKVAREGERDLTALPLPELLGCLEDRVRLAVEELPRETLKPAMFAAAALAELEQGLLPLTGSEDDAKATARALVLGVRPANDDDLPHALQSLADGSLSRPDFLRRFGHRGAKEMELAEPRWAEAPESLPSRSASGGTHLCKSDETAAAELNKMLVEKNATPALRKSLPAALRDARAFLALREAGKNVFMAAYGGVRSALLELGRRTQLGHDIFFLTLDELAGSERKAEWHTVIAQRKKERASALSIPVPPVLFSDDLDAIGRFVTPQGGTIRKGTPLSFGIYEGPALVLDEPLNAEDIPDGFVLVCPSTDPAWVPLFLRAGALVMETGGVLSHGAIVAREFGLPAVAGLPNVHRELKTGRRLHVDGGAGVVHLLDD